MKGKGRLAALGRVTCEITGEEPVRFFNLCRSRGICLYGLKKGETGYLCTLSVKDFFAIRHLSFLAGTHIRIVTRKGLPFFLKKIQKRSIFLVGMMGCALFLVWVSGFIWDIRISGNQQISDESILRYLQSQQVACGVAKGQIDAHETAEALRSAFPLFSWVSVEKRGTILSIQVEEARTGETVEDTKGESSLYADREGRIAGIVTRSGICQVQEGDYVYPGDLLISGEIPLTDDGGNIIRYEYCQADGDVLVETSYAYYDRISYTYQKRVYEKPRLAMVQLGFGDIRWQLSGDTEEGELMEQSYRFHLSEAFLLPFTLAIYKRAPYQETDCRYTGEEAAALLQSHFSEFFVQLRKKVMRITENNVKIVLYKDYAAAYGIVDTIESTGMDAPVEKTLQETERNDS